MQLLEVLQYGLEQFLSQWRVGDVGIVMLEDPYLGLLYSGHSMVYLVRKEQLGFQQG